MLVPTLPDARFLILDNADMPAALSVALAAEAAGMGHSDGRSDDRTPVLVPAWWGVHADQSMPLVHTAVERQAAVYGARTLATELVVEPDQSSGGYAVLSQLLMAAVKLAAREGCDAVLFPIQATELGESDELSVDIIAREVDRAALISRLACLDTGPCSVVTPLIDFDASQTIDLVRDMGVPVDLCWWSSASGEPFADAQASRWRGIRGDIAVSAAGSSAGIAAQTA
ncbi:MAG: hypothetical protein AB8F26_02305 [Phycisphaerales bacterium]